MSGKELTIRQIGEFCTNTLCKKLCQFLITRGSYFIGIRHAIISTTLSFRILIWTICDHITPMILQIYTILAFYHASHAPFG